MATNYADLSATAEEYPEIEPGREPLGGQIVGVRHGGRAAVLKRREVTFYAITKQGGALVALWYIATHATGWTEWSAFAVFYALNALALTVCYHRYFTHQAFETSRPMRLIFGIWAQLGAYGSLRNWCADHRRHHARSDRPGDPHSPFFDNYGRPLNALKGLHNAHMGWLFDDSTTDLAIYGKGLVDDPIISFCHATRFFWYGVSVLLIPALWALAFAGPEAILGTVLIAGFLRMTLALHAIALVASVCHRFGWQRFPGQGAAGNNFLIAQLSLGEGWHNNHHAHPRSANLGTTWWEVDVGAWVIWGLEKLGLIWNVRRFKLADLEQAR